jgi:hypothetical protein
MNDEIFVSFSSLKEPYSIFKTKLNGEWRKIYIH